VSVGIAWFFLREPAREGASPPGRPLLKSFRDVDRSCRRIILVAFLFTLARFSEGFLVLKAVEAGLGLAFAPLVLVVFNLSYVVLSYPAGALGDRHDPRAILTAGIGLLVAGNVVLATTAGLAGLAVGSAYGARTWR
jgi:MFS family permease